MKQYIQDQLNAVINEQSSKLLATLNELSVDYLPLLEKILGKAEKVVIKKTGKKTLMGAITGNEEGDKDKEGEADGQGGKEGEAGEKLLKSGSGDSVKPTPVV